MKFVYAVVASGLLSALGAQDLGLNVFPEYHAKPDQEMLDMAGKVEASKVINYLSEMKNRYNKMTPQHQADFQKHFQEVLAKNIAKLSPAQRQKRLDAIKKALALRVQNVDNLKKEVDAEYDYLNHWKATLQSKTFYEDLQQNGFTPSGATQASKKSTH
ncbi:DUF1104 domain-containing protein [Helicobacter baculiformis]|uniref:DUF1104 domain-containing protein n=1 Tax=Helicobacter baculiformis TaxID=427351 RepID=A0ABV7ZIA2_9HELI|nr:DUF1104 domain-containing protein [Helicobacter baculiformis]